MDGAFPSDMRGPPFDAMGRGGAPGGPRPAGRGFRGTAENAKTKLCTRWMSGDCRFGDRCNFAHGEQELRSLPPRNSYGAPGGYGAPAPGRGPFPGRGPGPMGAYGGRGRGYDDYYGGGGGYAAPAAGGYGAPAGPYGMPQDPYAAGGGGGYGAAAAPVQRGPGDDPYARQGWPVTGPNGWVAYRTQDTGEVYYHNHNLNITQWERPPEWIGP